MHIETRKRTIAYVVATVFVICFAFILHGLLDMGFFDPDPIVETKAYNNYSESLNAVLVDDYAPYSFVDKNGEPSGHNVEMLNEMANRMRVNLNIEILPQKEALERLSNGEADITNAIEFREYLNSGENIILSVPVNHDEFVVFAPRDYSSIANLFNKRIGVITKSYSESVLKPYGINTSISYFSNVGDLFDAFAEKKVDCIILRSAPGKIQIRENRISSLHESFVLGGSDMCLGIAKKDYELRDKINSTINEMFKDGEMEELEVKWLQNYVNRLSSWDYIVSKKYVWTVSALFLILIGSVIVIARGILHRHEQETVLSNFAQDYFLIYGLELNTGELTRYKAEHIDENFNMDEERLGYEEYIRRCIEHFVPEGEKAATLDKMKLDKVRQALLDKDIYYCDTTQQDGDTYHYLRFKYIKIKDHEDRVIFGGQFIDDAIKMEKAEKDAENVVRSCLGYLQYSEADIPVIEKMLEKLGAYYDAARVSVYEISNDSVFVSNNYEWCGEGTISVKRVLKEVDFGNYKDVFEQAFKEGIINVHDVDELDNSHEQLLVAMKRQGLKKTIIVPLVVDERMKGILAVDNPKANSGNSAIVKSVASLVGCEMLKLMQQDARDKERSDVITSLTRSYTYAYRVVLRENWIFQYMKSAEGTDNSELPPGKNYSEVIERYIENDVFELDREKIRRFTSEEYIVTHIHDRDGMVEHFRRMKNGFPVYHEIAIFPVGTFKRNGSILIGISDKHLELGNRLINKCLSDEMGTEFLVDLQSRCLAMYKLDGVDNSTPDQLMDFDSFMESLKDRVLPEYKDAFEKFCDIDTLIEDYKAVDRKEIVYRISKTNKPWRRLVAQVAHSKDGVPVTLFISIVEIDYERAQKLELMNKLTEQNLLLEEQQKELKKAREAADSANKAKTEYLYNMSHDIRTPMNAILGFTDMALKQIGAEDGKIRDYLVKIQSSNALLLGLINDILEVSKIENGRVELEYKPVNVLEFVNSIVSVNRGIADKNDVKLTMEVGRMSNFMILADSKHLNAVFMNLLSNAVKYSRGKSVRFGVEEITPSVENRVRLLFTVNDTGIGMSRSFVDQIFDSYKREKREVVEEIQGTGLGMAIVKSYVDAMEGTIEIDSEVNKGTNVSVIFEFDKDEENSEEKREKDLIAIKLSGKRLLLVEDNELNREIAEDVLTTEGIIVDIAHDGLEAVNLIKDRPVGYFDAVLMDIQMPVMDGYEASRQIRKFEGEKNNIPIIAMTANAFEEDKRKALEAGMDAHTSKPIVAKDLLVTLQKVIDSKNQM